MIAVSNEKAKQAADICKVLVDIAGKPTDVRTAEAVRKSKCLQKYLRKKIVSNLSEKENK